MVHPRPAVTKPSERTGLLPALRGEGELARERLLLAGLKLFAEQGYAKTSIRKIAVAANTNVAAVSYYFGNKAGLYRAVFWGDSSPASDPAYGPAAKAGTPIASLRRFFELILGPLRRGDQARLWIKLHRREVLEPTGLWEQKINLGMRPMHAWLVAHLCARLGVVHADDEVQALAVSVAGPAIHLLVNCEVVDVLAPQLLAGPEAIDGWCDRLLVNAEAMIEVERRRRKLAAQRKPARRSVKATRSVRQRSPAKAEPVRAPRSRA